MEQQTNKILDKISDKVSEILSVQDKILDMQQQMQEELKRVGNTVTKIEYEHGRKIDLILDVLTGHTEKFEENERRYEKDQKVIEMYGHKIYALEQQKRK